MARLLLPSRHVYSFSGHLVHFGTVSGARRKLQTRSAANTLVAMTQRSLQTLYAYWNELRAGRIAPRRLEIEPSRIAAILAETFMLERTDAKSFPYRLAGSRLCDLFGMELRGSDFLDGWNEEDRTTLEHLLASVCLQGGAAVLTLEAGAEARQRLELEVLLLPLMHSDNTVGRVIGAMSATSQPHWLTTQRLTRRRLCKHELIWPDGRPHVFIARSGHQAPFHNTQRETRIVQSEHRRFRVLDGGRSDPKNQKP
jgi:hypothetical protein